MRIVISYSITDAGWRNHLRSFLAPLEDNRLVTELWDRGSLQAGASADAEATAAFRRADMALVLLSARYLADKVLIQQELLHLLNERQSRSLILIPIILSPCLWESVPALNGLTAIPADRSALSQAQSVETALHQVATEISVQARRWHRAQLPTQSYSLPPKTDAKHYSANQETLRIPKLRPEELPPTRDTRLTLTTVAKPRRVNKSLPATSTLKTMAVGAFLFDVAKSFLKQLHQLAREAAGILIKYKLAATIVSAAGVTIVTVERHQRQPEKRLALDGAAPDASRSRSSRPSGLPLPGATPSSAQPMDSTPLPVIEPLGVTPANQPSRLPSPEKIITKAELAAPARPTGHSVKVPTVHTGSLKSSSSKPKDSQQSAYVAAQHEASKTSLPRTGFPLPRLHRIVTEASIQDDILHETKPALPAQAKLAYQTKNDCRDLTASYNVCLAENGTVSYVQVINGIPNADNEIMASIQKMISYPRREAVCFEKNIVYTKNEVCGGKIVLDNSIMKDKISKYDDILLSKELRGKLEGRGEGGMLTCSYIICVGSNGWVTQVAPAKSIAKTIPKINEDEKIITALKKWRFKPQAYEKCFLHIFEFHI